MLKDLSNEIAHLRFSSGVSNKVDDSTTQKKRSYRKSLKSLLGDKPPNRHSFVNADIRQVEGKTLPGLPPVIHNVHPSGAAQM